MKIVPYIKYFFYLASNWNLRIALHILPHEIRGEKQYNIHTTGADELQSMEKKGIDISHATIYMPADYDLLETFFSEIRRYQPQHLLDLGCGKGRAICVASRFGFLKLTGLDFSPELCVQAGKNIRETKKSYPALTYNIVQNDAFYFEIPGDVDCIFLFNPFDETIMKGVIKNIERSLKRQPRSISIIYFNPLHKQLFLKNGYKEVFYLKRIKYLEGAILHKEKNK